MVAHQYNIKNIHSINLIKYGDTKNVETPVLVKSIDAGPHGPQVMGNMDIKEVLENELKNLNVLEKETWILGGTKIYHKLHMKI